MLSHVGVFVLRLWIGFVGWCPEAPLRGVALLVARLAVLTGLSQKTLRANLELIYGDRLSVAEKGRIALAANQNLFLLFIEMAKAANPRCARAMASRVSFDDPALIDSCDVDPRGVVFAVAHSGNFDLCSVWWTNFRNRPLGAIMKPLENPVFNDLLLETRKVFGVEVFSTKSETAVEDINAFVAAGSHLCILPDQNARRRGVNVRFMGQPASTFKGATRTYMANHERARLIAAVPIRVGAGREIKVYLEEIEGYQPSGDADADQRALTQRVCDSMSRHVERHPGSYLWHHKRWDKAWKADGFIEAPSSSEAA